MVQYPSGIHTTFFSYFDALSLVLWYSIYVQSAFKVSKASIVHPFAPQKPQPIVLQVWLVGRLWPEITTFTHQFVLINLYLSVSNLT